MVFRFRFKKATKLYSESIFYVLFEVLAIIVWSLFYSCYCMQPFLVLSLITWTWCRFSFKPNKIDSFLLKLFKVKNVTLKRVDTCSDIRNKKVVMYNLFWIIWYPVSIKDQLAPSYRRNFHFVSDLSYTLILSQMSYISRVICVYLGIKERTSRIQQLKFIFRLAQLLSASK